MTGRAADIHHHRAKLPFRAVNQRGRAGFDPGVQRHHLLPQQILTRHSLARMIATVGIARLGIDDFRCNGMLLPCQERTAIRMGLPLHCGPHRAYSALVIERVGMIEAIWAGAALRDADQAAETAILQIALLQRALRRRLFQGRCGAFRLNRRDLWGQGPELCRAGRDG